MDDPPPFSPDELIYLFAKERNDRENPQHHGADKPDVAEEIAKAGEPKPGPKTFSETFRDMDSTELWFWSWALPGGTSFALVMLGTNFAPGLIDAIGDDAFEKVVVVLWAWAVIFFWFGVLIIESIWPEKETPMIYPEDF